MWIEEEYAGGSRVTFAMVLACREGKLGSRSLSIREGRQQDQMNEAPSCHFGDDDHLENRQHDLPLLCSDRHVLSL